MKVKSESEVAQSCPTLATHGLQPTRLLRPWDFLAKSAGVGCHCLLLITRQYQLFFLVIATISDSKASACNAEDLGSIPELGRSPGEGNGNPLQYSCLENPMD